MKLKSLLLLVALASFQISGLAQVSYEGSQDKDLSSFKLDNGELKYASYQNADKVLVLYNADYSMWKTVTLHIPKRQYFDQLKSISLNVFNTDDRLELAYTTLEYLSNNDTEVTTNHVDVRPTLFIIKEDGSMVLEAENSSHMEVVDNSGTRKLWVYKREGQDQKEKVDIYSLPDAPLGELFIDQGNKGSFQAHDQNGGI